MKRKPKKQIIPPPDPYDFDDELWNATTQSYPAVKTDWSTTIAMIFLGFFAMFGLVSCSLTAYAWATTTAVIQVEQLDAATQAIVEPDPPADVVPLHARDAVVRVHATGGIGSGVAISPTLILTANHVVEGETDVIIEICNEFGGSRPIKGKVIRTSPISDLALIETTERFTTLASLSVSAAEALRPGDVLVCIGATKGHTAWNCTRGFLSAKGAPDIADQPTLWQMSAGAWFGNSGGAVYCGKTYKLIGILVAGTSPFSNFFVPANEIAGFLRSDGK